MSTVTRFMLAPVMLLGQRRPRKTLTHPGSLTKTGDTERTVTPAPVYPVSSWSSRRAVVAASSPSSIKPAGNSAGSDTDAHLVPTNDCRACGRAVLLNEDDRLARRVMHKSENVTACKSIHSALDSFGSSIHQTHCRRRPWTACCGSQPPRNAVH